MATRNYLSAKERRARERKILRASLLISAVVHLCLFSFWEIEPVLISPFAAAGPRAGDSRAADGSLQAMNLSVAPTRPIVPPLIPLPSVEVEPVEIFPETGLDLSALSGDRPGTESAPGIEGGEGRGDGGTAEEGLFRLIPPSPRGLIMPPPTNDRLRGTQIQVWVFVDERGLVVPDSTRLRPPTRDRGYNRRLIEEAAEWVFEPARQGGEPVASWFPYTISM